MQFQLTEEQQLIQQTARDFADREIMPVAAQLDEEARYPEEIVKKMADLGLMGVAIPEQWGGGGMDMVSYALACEEISRACAGTGVIMSVNNSLVCDPLLKYATDEQKEKVLKPLASGEVLGCFGLTEPIAGSDASMIRTTAVDKGDYWLLNGEKNFITNAPESKYSILFAVHDREARHRGITAFILDMELDGVSTGPKEKKLGILASHSSSIFIEDAKVPKDMILGKLGEGFKVAMTTLDCGRIGIAAQACGIARAALEESVAYAGERVAFGGPIARQQAVQFKLADMATQYEAAHLLTLKAAWAKDQGKRHTKESSIAKIFASEAAMFISREAVQIHGGYGYSKDYPAERHYRDAKITEIYEGTNEIQRVVIASNLLK